MLLGSESVVACLLELGEGGLEGLKCLFASVGRCRDWGLSAEQRDRAWSLAPILGSLLSDTLISYSRTPVRGCFMALPLILAPLSAYRLT